MGRVADYFTLYARKQTELIIVIMDYCLVASFVGIGNSPIRPPKYFILWIVVYLRATTESCCLSTSWVRTGLGSTEEFCLARVISKVSLDRPKV